MPYLSESRDIYLHLAQVNPQDLEWISRLAYVEGLLGWGAREQKDFALSLRYFTQGVARTAALCARSPENTTYRTEWAVQLIEAGVAYNLVGQRIEATQVLEQALSLLEALRAKAPHPIQAELMAEAYVHLGRKEEARAKMLECLQAKFMTEEVRALAKTARIPLP
jgi:tetratricopeptide (TPR) repeat protein